MRVTVQIDDKIRKFHEIFSPDLIEGLTKVESQEKRFVYYTSADTAIKVLRNQELWFRNAMVMNDFSEISYGLTLVRRVFSGLEGQRFSETVDDIFPDTLKKSDELFSEWERDWRQETYIACVSVHDPAEDRRGRLSMWRAYGNAAIVVKNTPMISASDILAVYSTPVLYLSESDLNARLARITDNILINGRYLQKLGQKTLVSYIHDMLSQLAIATKHPGFEEEKEWRLFYRPTEGKSPAMAEDIVVLNSIPQKIYKLRLKNEPENGLYGADIPSLIERIIIGPTQFPYVSYRAFTEVLERLGVADAASKVVISDIPLRTG